MNLVTKGLVGSAAVLALGLIGTAASAGTMTGTVVSNGAPIAGAMVTAFSPDQKRRDTAYTDASGRYTLSVDFGGKFNVRARMMYYKDKTTEVNLPVAGAMGLNFAIDKHSVAQELSDSLGASAHLATLEWNGEKSRSAFISQCNYCHQMGNELTRAPKPKGGWESTVTRMEGYFAVLTNDEANTIIKTLDKGFDGKPVTAFQQQPYFPELAKATIQEWNIGDAMTFIHDADVGEDDHLYGTDEGKDIIWFLDRKTGRIEEYPLPPSGLPEGGVFHGVQLPIGILTGSHGPHSMAQAKDGKFWITNSLSSTLMSFDPETKKFKVFELGHNRLYPHTVRIDKEGIVWFTVVVSNELVRFDPKTEKFTVMHLPETGFWSGFTHWLFPWVLRIGNWFPKQNMHMGVNHVKWAFQGRAAMPFPYGIDVNPVDGSIWYAKLHANKIGRVDPKTMKVTEFDTPLKGPRRMRFDAQGNLWIPAFEDGGMMRFDPKKETFETIRLPVLAHNQYEVPYALAVHPKTQDIWITSNMSDRAFRYTPKTKSFITYPMPTKVTWLRDWAFTKDGGVCSSSSNLPSYGIEGGFGGFMCIYPDGKLAQK